MTDIIRRKSTGEAWETVPDTGGGGGSQPFLTHTTTLDSTQIQALNLDLGSPPEIVPAPGAGKVIVPSLVVLVSNPGSVPFYAEDAAIGFVVAYASNPTPTQSQYLGKIPCNGDFPTTLPSATLKSLLGSLTKRVATIPITGALLSTSANGADASLSEADADSALILWSGVLWSGGSVTAAHVAAAGSGYAPGDLFRAISPESVYQGGGPPQTDCQCTVLTVDGGGGVLTFSIDGGGMNFIAGTTYATEHDSGGGDDALTIVVDAAPPGNGTLDVTTYYTLVTF